MSIFLLRSDDPELIRTIQSMVSAGLPEVPLLCAGSSKELADFLGSLGGPLVLLFDAQLSEAPPTHPWSTLWILPPSDTGAPPTLQPCIGRPPRAPELLSLLRLLLGKGTEDQRWHSRGAKAEAIARFQSGLAHDLNNRLTTLLGNIQFLSELLPDEQELVQDMHEAAHAAESLVGQVQAFTRLEPLPPHSVDLGALLRGLYESLRRLCLPPGRVEMLLPPTPCFVLGDECALQQILLNLVASVEPASGSLLLELMESPPGRLVLSTDNGSQVELDSPALPGLSTTRALLSRLGISYETGINGITLRFPLASPPPLSMPHVAEFPCPVLVAESHPALRRCLSRHLQSRGAIVMESPDALHLTQQLQHAKDSPRWVVVDPDLPGGGSEAVAPWIARVHRVLWTPSCASDLRSLRSQDRIVPKPYTVQTLLAAFD